jgi:type IV pilus assembly protein PilC
MLALPIFGKIARTSCYARFARTLATTYAAGVPLVEALHSVAGATGNAVYEDATHDIATAVSGGAAAAQVDQRHRPVPVYARADE